MGRGLGGIFGTLAVVVALASVGAAAQFELGPGYTIDGWEGVLGSWESGPGLAAGMVGSTPGVVRPEVRLSWRAAAFDRYGGFEPPHIPEVSYSEYCGDTAEFWQGSLGFRFVGQPSGRTYFALRTGILVARLGAVEHLWWDNTNPSHEGIERARGTGVTCTEGYFGVGIGAIVWGAPDRGFALEGEAIAAPNVGGLSARLGGFALF